MSSVSSFSSSIAPSWKHDVFLSFRGEDTRTGFTSHLYTALIKSGINTFMDDEKLQIGKTIRPELLEAIQESRFAVVVLSGNYASSTWCLDELTMIVDCMETKELIVVPVFYYVDPSDLRHQRKTFESDFAKHEEDETADKVETWRTAFCKVGGIAGSHVNGDRKESEVIAMIARRIFQELQDTIPRAVTKDLVGIESRLKEMNELLSIESHDIRFIGICGMSGMGKTVLAEAVYMGLRNQFEGDCFIGNIKDISRKNDSDLMKLQQKVLVDILKEEGIRVRSLSEGISMMQRRLRGMKILLLLDDVNELDQLNCLAKESDWFGCGSRIIITTTNEELLISHNVHGRYKCEGLNLDDASRVFYLAAFRSQEPKPGYEELSNKIVELAGGLPLALNVFGSLLYGKEETIWRETLRKLQKCPEKRILERLEVCYDRLDSNEQEIFIYLACFLKGRDESLVKDILKNIGLHPVRGIDILINRSLVTISYDDSVWMHDLLQQMGWEILRKQSINNPGKRRGVMSRQDIVDIVTSKEKGSMTIEIINQDSFGVEVENCCGSSHSFSEMKRLKFLRIGNLRFPNGLEYLSNDLRIVEWSKCSLISLPSTFEPNQLFELNMCSSLIKKLWDKDLDMPNLRSIYLCHSKNLTKIPDLTSAPNLVILNLEGCTSLVEVHESVLAHKKLRYVNMKRCVCLQQFRRSNLAMEALEALHLSGCLKLKSIPHFGETMNRLEHLYLDGTDICELPDSLGEVHSLTKIDVSGTAIRELPSSILNLNRLRSLRSHGCPLLVPNKCLLYMNPQRALFALKELDLSDCNLSTVPADAFVWLSSLIELDLSGNDFVMLPASTKHLSHLRMFRLNRCKNLQSLPKRPEIKDELYGPTVKFAYYVSGEELDISKFHVSGGETNRTVSCLNCPKLVGEKDRNSLAYTILTKYFQVRTSSEVIPEAVFEIVSAGDEIPQWFNNQGTGNSASVELPPGWYDSTCIGVAVCAVYDFHYKTMIHMDGSANVEYEIDANLYLEGKHFVTSVPITLLRTDCENQSVWYWNITDDIRRLVDPSVQNVLSICFFARPEDGNLEIRKYGVRFISLEDLPKLEHSDAAESSNSRCSAQTMAGSIIFLSTEQLLEKITSALFCEIGQNWGFDSDLKKLGYTLVAIKSVLLDATEKKDHNSLVENWLGELEAALYDLNDLFDDLLTEYTQLKVEIGQNKRKDVSNFFSGLSTLACRVKMNRKIKKLSKKVEEIEKHGEEYALVDKPLVNQVACRSREETEPFLHAHDIIGRDLDKEEILRLLLHPESNDNSPSMLPIVGVEGVGKTTLAKLVYNDPKIEQNFAKRIWVCVSSDPDIQSILKKILKAAGSGTRTTHLGMYQVLTHLQNHLNSEKFLLVLDDFSLYDTSELNDMLRLGAKGSRIIVTARRVAQAMGTFQAHYLHGLPADDCLLILLQCAFKDGQFPYLKLMKIGKDIVNKCAGNPLAVRILGGLLCTTIEESDWSSILNGQRICDPYHLAKLSFEQMPIHLQHCLAHCNNFPSGYEFKILELIYLWISKGLVQPSDEDRPLEEIGYEYVRELISRSFFVDVERNFDGELSTFKMHQGLESFVTGDNDLNDLHVSESMLPEMLRYVLRRYKRKRSLYTSDFVRMPSTMNSLHLFIKAFQSLRVLKLSGSEFVYLPRSIGTLRHLRYLCLKGNCNIRALPDSVCDLKNLLVLDLMGCTELQKLPRHLCRLRGLRYLAITSWTICVPKKELKGLSSLQFLYIFNCCSLISLSNGIQHLTALRELSIVQCPRLISLPQGISELTSLKKLVIEGCEKLDLLKGDGIEGVKSIRSLTIGGLPMLTQFPHWLQNSAATLRYLQIKDCPSLETLIWLKNCTVLLKLQIVNCARLVALSSEMHQLIDLQYLHLQGCPLLAKKCERERGDYWPWIQHVSEVHIDQIAGPGCSASQMSS